MYKLGLILTVLVSNRNHRNQIESDFLVLWQSELELWAETCPRRIAKYCFLGPCWVIVPNWFYGAPKTFMECTIIRIRKRRGRRCWRRVRNHLIIVNKENNNNSQCLDPWIHAIFDAQSTWVYFVSSVAVQFYCSPVWTSPSTIWLIDVCVHDVMSELTDKIHTYKFKCFFEVLSQVLLVAVGGR